MREEAAEAGLHRSALTDTRSSEATIWKKNPATATIETCAKRSACRQWRHSARPVFGQADRPEESIKQSSRRHRATERTVSGATKEIVAPRNQVSKSEHSADRMLQIERPSEQVRWNASSSAEDGDERVRGGKSIPDSNRENDCFQQLSMDTLGHKSLDVHNESSSDRIQEIGQFKEGRNSFKQRPNKSSLERPEQQLSYTIHQFSHNRSAKFDSPEDRATSSCRISHLRTQKQAYNKILLLALLVITTLACSRLATSGVDYQVSAYQLANNLIANNLPPKFITGTSGAGTGASGGVGSNSEIVVRVKEGSASIGKLIYTLKGEDPDDDPLTFGVLGSIASDLLRIENVPGNQANVFLRKELDRETTESYQVVITLTDGKLGRGNWVSLSC